MKKIALAVAISLIASSSFAGGVKEAFEKEAPKVQVKQKVPLFVLLGGGALGVGMLAALGDSATSSSTTN